MELKQYLDIFMGQIRTFLAVVLVSLFCAFVWSVSQPQSYQATLLLNIGRGSLQHTDQYTYDSFYRLQADERFADTVVRWLGTPRIVEDIYAKAGLSRPAAAMPSLKNAFQAKRLSSQMIEVVYADPDAATLKQMAGAAVVVLNEYTQSLNQENGTAEWFVVIGNDPVIRDARVSLSFVLAIGLIFGVFIGFWAALLRHYFRKNAG
jgi:uncharacterized protein involved in exopolysaccharide biosynthesis